MHSVNFAKLRYSGNARGNALERMQRFNKFMSLAPSWFPQVSKAHPFSFKEQLGNAYKWARADPPRAAQAALAVYQAYAGASGGYIPYSALYHATKVYDRQKPRRKRFQLRRGDIAPSRAYLRTQRLKYQSANYGRSRYGRRWLPYREWKRKYHWKNKRINLQRAHSWKRHTRVQISPYYYRAANKYPIYRHKRNYAGRHLIHHTPYKW